MATSGKPFGQIAVPPLWREGRAPGELAALLRDPVFAGRGVPHGNGQPVLLVPGYMAGDGSFAVMARWLRRIGYRPRRAGIVLNADCATATLDRLEARLTELGAPVAIIGQSRGGSLARLLATRRPDVVTGIVTLGSPALDELAVHPLVRLNLRIVSSLGRLGVPGLLSASCLDGDCCAATRELSASAFPTSVGWTAIYSRSDGIVDWRACLAPDAELVEVDASHLGMGVNAASYRAIAAALQTVFASPPSTT
jgi:pimeloyl-ACP methyl ester carboxylesterase